MKFFTRAWATGELTDEEYAKVPDAYWKYLAALHLPPAVAAFSKINVHDAHILAVDHQPEHSLLTLRLRCGDLQRGYSDITLVFSQVTVDLGTVDTLRRAVRPACVEVLHDEIVEVLYDEVDFLAERFDYRMLFYPDGEVSVQFGKVDIIERPVEDRYTV
jgi:hypothetical protein